MADFAKEKPWRPPSLVLETDPPEHDRARAVLKRVLSPAAMKQLRAGFAAAAEAKVREIVRKSRFDAITELAQTFPLSVFPDAVGLRQEGREHLLPYANLAFNAFGPPNELRQQALDPAAPHVAWVTEQCQREKLAPGGLGAQIHAATDTGEITKDEAPVLVRSLLTAGLDTNQRYWCRHLLPGALPGAMAKAASRPVAGACRLRRGGKVRIPGPDLLPHHDEGGPHRRRRDPGR